MCVIFTFVSASFAMQDVCLFLNEGKFGIYAQFLQVGKGSSRSFCSE